METGLTMRWHFLFRGFTPGLAARRNPGKNSGPMSLSLSYPVRAGEGKHSQSFGSVLFMRCGLNRAYICRYGPSNERTKAKTDGNNPPCADFKPMDLLANGFEFCPVLSGICLQAFNGFKESAHRLLHVHHDFERIAIISRWLYGRLSREFFGGGWLIGPSHVAAFSQTLAVDFAASHSQTSGRVRPKYPRIGQIMNSWVPEIPILSATSLLVEREEVISHFPVSRERRSSSGRAASTAVSIAGPFGPSAVRMYVAITENPTTRSLPEPVQAVKRSPMDQTFDARSLDSSMKSDLRPPPPQQRTKRIPPELPAPVCRSGRVGLRPEVRLPAV